MAPRILNLGARWRCLISVLVALPPGRTPISNEQEAGRAARCAKFSEPTEIRTPDRSAGNLDAIPPTPLKTPR